MVDLGKKKVITGHGQVGGNAAVGLYGEKFNLRVRNDNKSCRSKGPR